MKKGVSRQRKWQLKKLEEGCCEECGKPRNLFAHWCDAHGLYHRIQHRKTTGKKPYSGIGRKPFPVKGDSELGIEEKR